MEPRILAAKIHNPVALRAPGQLPRILLRGAFHENTLKGSDEALAAVHALLPKPCLQERKARLLLFLGDRILEISRWRARATAINEAEGVVEVDLRYEVHGGFEILGRFPREAHDEIRGHHQVGAQGSELPHLSLVLEDGMPPFHERQNSIGARLHREMEIIHQLRHLAVHLDQALGELHGVAGGEADAIDAVDGRHVGDELR